MKKLLFLVTALLAMVQQSSAQTTPVITVDDVEAVPGETVAFSLNLTGGRVNQYTALQFDVQFPATGFSTIAGGYTVNTSAWVGASCTVGSVDETGLATIPFASDEAITAANVEDLVSVSFKVASTVGIGVYEVTLKNIFLGYNTSDKDYPANVTFKVKVVSRKTLDETSSKTPSTYNDINVLVKRTIKANEWSTICLPFDMTANQVYAAFGNDVEMALFDSYTLNNDGTEITVSFGDTYISEFGVMANCPYIIKTSTNITEFTVDNVNVNPDEENAITEYTNGKNPPLKKVYGKFKGTYHAGTTVPNNCLFLSGNKFWYSTGNTNMKAFRGYFDFVDVLSDIANARIGMSFDDEPTDVKHVTFNMKHDTGEWYTLDGRKLDKKPTEKGVYVRDGRKVVIK